MSVRLSRSTLTFEPGIEHNLGINKTKITPMETLKRFKDKSIGGVLSVWSLPYTRFPLLVMKSIDRVLLPGGQILFYLPELPWFARLLYRVDKKPNYRNTQIILNFFRNFGYETEVINKDFETVILAKKPLSPLNSPKTDSQ